MNRPRPSGVIIKNVMIENGTIRHAMNAAQLDRLYVALEEFIADCTTAEYAENAESFKAIQTLIHQRINNPDSGTNQ